MMHLLLVVSLATSVPIAPDSLDACGLYTREDVAALAGESTKKPRTFTIDPAMHSSCTTETSSGKLTVKVYIERASSKEMMQTKLKTLKGVVTNTTSQALKPVSGLGDEAYWGQIGPTNGQFHVVIATTMVSIQTWGKAPGAGTMEKTRPIADLVIKRYKERYAGK
jgi:hypothetical protein